MKTVLALAALLLSLGSPTSAQSISSGSGAVRGSVLDPSGAVIKGAAVEISSAYVGYLAVCSMGAAAATGVSTDLGIISQASR